MFSDMPNILPRELTTKIYRYLSNQELCSLRQTSRLFYESTLFSFLSRLKSEAVVDIVAQPTYTFFLKKNGTVWTCGDGFDGQLGIEDPSSARATLKQIPNLPKIKKIVSQFYHTFFLTTKGKVYACGATEGPVINQQGWLGVSALYHNENFVYTPRLLSLPCGVKDIVISDQTSFFLLEDHRVFACGVNDCHQLGIGDALHYDTPMETNLRDVKKIIANEHNTFFILQDGSVKVCGQNQSGCLGVGHVFPEPNPVQLKDFPPITNIISGYDNTFFITSNGEAFFSGQNSYGQGGVGDTLPHITPTVVPLPEKVKQIKINYNHSLFLLNNNQVYVSGHLSSNGITANAGGFFLQPICLVSNIKHIVDKHNNVFDKYNDGNFFITHDDHVLNCGLNANEETMAAHFYPIMIDLPGKVKQVVASRYRTFYLLENNTVYFNGCRFLYGLLWDTANIIDVPQGIGLLNQSQMLLQQIEEALTEDHHALTLIP